MNASVHSALVAADARDVGVGYANAHTFYYI